MSRDAGTPDARGQPEAFAPRRDVAGPRRFFSMGQEGIVEWHTPDRPVSNREFVTLASLIKRVECESTLPIAQLIFHCGRCGSTLLGRMLEVDPANRVLLEPNALQRYLELKHEGLERPEIRRELQVLVAAYGLETSAEERRLIIKLSSTMIVHADLLHACFPEAQLLYLLRDPTEVVASELRGLASFLQPKKRREIAALFGEINGDVDPLSDAEWCAWYLDRNLRKAQRHADLFTRAIDYADHRTAYLEACNALGTKVWLPTDPEMIAVLGAYSKQPRVNYSAESDARKVPAGLRDVVDPITREAYGWWCSRRSKPK